MAIDSIISSNITYRELFRLCTLAEPSQTFYRFSEFIKLMDQLESLGYIEIDKPCFHPDGKDLDVFDNTVTLTELGTDSLDLFANQFELPDK